MPKQYHKNPRNITKKQYEMLQENIALFGDISGVVVDLNSDEIIGGNQRSKAIELEDCEIEIVNRYDSPTAQGTVAEGYILVPNQLGKEPIRMNYREVRWTEQQCERANISANKMGGTFDFEMLANEFEMSVLEESGFEEWELGVFDEKEVEEKEEQESIPEVDVEVHHGDELKVHLPSGSKYSFEVGEEVTLDPIFAKEILAVLLRYSEIDVSVNGKLIERKES